MTELQCQFDGVGCPVLAWSAHNMSAAAFARIRDGLLGSPQRRDAATGGDEILRQRLGRLRALRSPVFTFASKAPVPSFRGAGKHAHNGGFRRDFRPVRRVGTPPLSRVTGRFGDGLVPDAERLVPLWEGACWTLSELAEQKT
jgi:hypothetical protein